MAYLCEDILLLSLKVDREDHFQRPGFLHIICVFLGYKPQISLKKLGVTDV